MSDEWRGEWLEPKVERNRGEENEHKSELIPMLEGMTRVVEMEEMIPELCEKPNYVCWKRPRYSWHER